MHQLPMRYLAPFVILAGIAVASAQDTTIRTTVPLVVLSTSVIDAHRRPIYGLKAEDFVVRDNGTPRRVYAYPTDAGLPPIALVVVVQTNGLSAAAIAKIDKVGAMIPEAVIGDNGEAAVLSFSDEVRIVQNFTHNAENIENAFQGLASGGNNQSHMLDAVNTALAMLEDHPGAHRSSILIIGEARDHGSVTKLNKLLERTQRVGATIYSLNYSSLITPFTAKPGDYEPSGGGAPDYTAGISALVSLAKKKTAEVLVDATGGQRIGFETQSGLENDLIELGRDIHSRYLIAFSPVEDSNTSFHKIEVTVKDHPDAVVKTRPGYWSGGNP